MRWKLKKPSSTVMPLDPPTALSVSTRYAAGALLSQSVKMKS